MNSVCVPASNEICTRKQSAIVEASIDWRSVLACFFSFNIRASQHIRERYIGIATMDKIVFGSRQSRALLLEHVSIVYNIFFFFFSFLALSSDGIEPKTNCIGDPLEIGKVMQCSSPHTNHCFRNKYKMHFTNKLHFREYCFFYSLSFGEIRQDKTMI